MSNYSPCVVSESEVLALFLYNPMHFDRKGRLKPNIFSHVHLRGRSIQREDIASNNELWNFVKNFLGADEKRAWKGVLLGKCQEVRNLYVDDSRNRSVCVYDTANHDNVAHGELCQTHHVAEADEPELRAELFAIFGSGAVVLPGQYRNGEILNRLPNELQART